MGLVLYKYEEINGKHFVKLAQLVNETQAVTKTVALTSILSGEVKADNVQSTPGGFIIEGQKITSTEKLLEVLSGIKAIQIGTDSNGKPIMINTTGIVISTPQTAAQPVTAAQTVTSSQQTAPTTDADRQRIDQLTILLNNARDYYYNTGTEMMSNFEYDALTDELAALEKKTGYIRQDSPNKNVGADVKSAGPTVAANKNLKQGTKVAHEEDALSLDKTKDIADLIKLLCGKMGVLSVKMDGLTIVLTYEGGELQYAVTRGNGHIGEIVTENAKNMIGVPLTIDYKGKLVVRGEAYMTYSSFNAVNSSLPDGVEPFKNPRNLAAGTIRTFDKPKIVKNRQIRFCAFEIVNWEDIGLTSVNQMLSGLEKLGFTDTVKRVTVNATSMQAIIEQFTAAIKASDIPADGLVLRLDDLEYGQSLGTTGKFPRHSMAFKWEDAEVETELIRVDWTVGRTGIITPTAVFKPVDIEGSTIQRASIHNLSMMTQVLGRPYVGQKIWVYKANLIIPQVSKAEHINSNMSGLQLLNIPTACPHCGQPTVVRTDPSSGVDTLWCTNKECAARSIAKWEHFVSRDAMNINGLGTAVLQDMIDINIINEHFYSLYEASFEDFFRLCTELEGYGETKVSNIINAVTASKKTTLERVVYSLGIPNVGLQTAKQIVKLANWDIDNLTNPGIISDIANAKGLGAVAATSYRDYMSAHIEDFYRLADALDIEEHIQQTGELVGLVFCCTGAVNVYAGRKALQASIEARGGKFTTSVSGNTSYLITNDTTSGSAKNKAAAKLGIPVITEQEFIDKFGM